MAVPAAAGPSGSGAARCEHQRRRAALVRAQGCRGVVQARLAAYGGGGTVWNERGNLVNVEKQGEHELQCIT